MAGGSAVVATGLLAIPAGCRGKIYPGTIVLDSVDLGGMTRTQARTLVNTRLASFQDAAITFRLHSRMWTASLADLGATIDIDAALDQAELRGRDDGFVGRYSTWLAGSTPAETITIPVTINETTLAHFLQRLASDVDIEARNASLGPDLVIRQDVPGLSVDIEKVARQVRAALGTLTPTTLGLATLPVPPAVTATDLEAFRDAAAALIAEPVTVADDATGQSWIVEPEALARALILPSADDPVSASPFLDPNALLDSVIPIANALWIAPVNATVGWDAKPFIVNKATAGRKVDATELAEAVAEAASSESRLATPPATDLPAEISAETLPTLGLDAVLGAGDSSYSGSSEARSENVRVAANHISGTLIAPGAQFSFNQSLGPITVENGYVEGKIIQGDWYTSDLGGGVCQVSTTAYRAALYAGMNFDEWHAHSFRVSFYELDGWPPGVDAAIYQPNTPDEWELDLRFTNTSDAWMLLQMVEQGDGIVAQLIGTSPRVIVTVETPIFGNPLPPPEPMERQTDSLPAGQRQKLQEAAPGVVVTLTRTISKDGVTIDEDIFISEYAAQPEIWGVGTGPTASRP